MNKFAAITFVALVGLVGLVALVSASGYGYSAPSYGYSAPSYGQNYERKTGYKTVSRTVCPLLSPSSARPE